MQFCHTLNSTLCNEIQWTKQLGKSKWTPFTTGQTVTVHISKNSEANTVFQNTLSNPQPGMCYLCTLGFSNSCTVSSFCWNLHLYRPVYHSVHFLLHWDRPCDDCATSKSCFSYFGIATWNIWMSPFCSRKDTNLFCNDFLSVFVPLLFDLLCFVGDCNHVPLTSYFPSIL